jgi:hypothetical protein
MFAENYAMLGYPVSNSNRLKAPTVDETFRISTTNKNGIVSVNYVHLV